MGIAVEHLIGVLERHQKDMCHQYRLSQRENQPLMHNSPNTVQRRKLRDGRSCPWVSLFLGCWVPKLALQVDINEALLIKLNRRIVTITR